MTEDLIYRARGKGIYESKIGLIKSASIGNLDGAITKYRLHAQDLLTIDRALGQEERNHLFEWLGKGGIPEPVLENALMGLGQRLERIRSMT